MDLLHHFTWRQFGLTALLVLAAYYALLWLVFYRKTPADEVLPHSLAGLPEDEGGFELLGAAEEPEGSSVVPSDGFGFAGWGKQTDGPEQDFGEEQLQGLIPDVLEEVKQVLHTVETKGGGKADFIALFKRVSAKYGRLKASRHLGAINDWITDNLPFELTEDEVWSLWD